MSVNKLIVWLQTLNILMVLYLKKPKSSGYTTWIPPWPNVQVGMFKTKKIQQACGAKMELNSEFTIQVKSSLLRVNAISLQECE